jgi:hypothetical protein
MKMCLHEEEGGQDFQSNKELIPHNLLQGEKLLALTYHWQCSRQCEYS